jgi:hypothetical protein
MTFSWYTNNCADSPTACAEDWPANVSRTHYEGDVNATLRWGMSGVKVDGCGAFNNMTLYAELYNQSGKAVLIESCHGTSGCTPDPATGGFKPDGTPGTNTSSAAWGICPYFKPNGDLVCPFHYFRVSADVSFSFDSMMGNLQEMIKFVNVSRPGCWAHPDSKLHTKIPLRVLRSIGTGT